MLHKLTLPPVPSNDSSHGEGQVNTEDRLVDIEIKLARQDDMVEALNRMVYQQQKKIDELETLCSGLARRVREIQDVTEDSVADEKPPHY